LRLTIRLQPTIVPRATVAFVGPQTKKLRKEKVNTEMSNSIFYRIYDGFVNWAFLISITISLGLSIRIIRILTPLEKKNMPKYKHLFYGALFFPGFAFVLVNVFPVFKTIKCKNKSLIFLLSLGLLASVAFIMAFFSTTKT